MELAALNAGLTMVATTLGPGAPGFPPSCRSTSHLPHPPFFPLLKQNQTENQSTHQLTTHLGAQKSPQKSLTFENKFNAAVHWCIYLLDSSDIPSLACQNTKILKLGYLGAASFVDHSEVLVTRLELQHGVDFVHIQARSFRSVEKTESYQFCKLPIDVKYQHMRAMQSARCSAEVPAREPLRKLRQVRKSTPIAQRCSCSKAERLIDHLHGRIVIIRMLALYLLHCAYLLKGL